MLMDNQARDLTLLPEVKVSDKTSVFYSVISYISSSSFWTVFHKLLALALPMGASFTFGFNVLLIGILAGYIEGDDSTKTANLGAAALTSSLINALWLFTFGHLYSIGIYTGKKRGRLKQIIQNRGSSAGNTEMDDEMIEIKAEISKIPRNGVLTCIGLPVSMAVMYHSELFLISLSQNSRNAFLVQTYTRPAMGAFPFLALRMCFEQVLFAYEKQRPAMIIGLINFMMGLLISITLCFGKFSFPKLGITGVAYGLLIESFFTCLGFGLCLSRHPDFKEYRFFSSFQFLRTDWLQMKSLLKIGLPILFTLINETIGELLVSLFSGWFGPDEIAARNFGTLLVLLITIPLISSGQSTCQEVSRLIGAGDYENANRFARYGLVSSLMMITPLNLTVVISPALLTHTVANTGNVDNRVLSLAEKMVRMVILGMFGDMARYNMLQASRAAGSNNLATGVSIASQCLGIALAYLIGFKTQLGLYGLIIGDTAGKWSGALGMFPIWYRSLKTDILAARESKIEGIEKKVIGVLGGSEGLKDSL